MGDLGLKSLCLSRENARARMDASNASKVIVIEDDPEFGEFLELLLQEAADETLLCVDGIEGLRASLRDKPDLVVLDLNLPSLRGEEILRLLRSSPDHSNIRILICSEMPREQRREMELLNLGADAYIEKPFMEEAFLEDVRGLLVSARESRAKSVSRYPSSPALKRLPDEESTPSNRGLSRSEEDSTASTRPPVAGIADGAGLSSARAFPTGASTEEMEEVTLKSSDDAIDERLFPDYQLLGVIGAGNMGTVYKARQMSGGKVAALKVLLRSRADTMEAIDRFKREAKIMERVDHPNVLKVYGAGNTGFTFYIAMEYAGGGSLDDWIGRLNWPECGLAIQQACDAIIHLHDRGIIHRDIKPANILIAEDGSIRIGDFGISRAQLPEDQAEFTKVASLMGTPLYMAPELMLGSPANELSDQFAFGRTILRLFEGETFQMPPPDIDRLRPDLPASLREAIKRCLSMYPQKRFTSMRDAKRAFLADWDSASATAAQALLSEQRAPSNRWRAARR